MAKEEDRFGHFIELPGGSASLTELGKILIEKRRRIIDLSEHHKKAVDLRELVLVFKRNTPLSGGEGVKNFSVEIPNDYKENNLSENIIFLSKIESRISELLDYSSMERNFREGDEFIIYSRITNINELSEFIYYVYTAINNTLAELEKDDPLTVHGQKYLNSPVPKIPGGYSPDDPDRYLEEAGDRLLNASEDKIAEKLRLATLHEYHDEIIKINQKISKIGKGYSQNGDEMPDECTISLPDHYENLSAAVLLDKLRDLEKQYDSIMELQNAENRPNFIITNFSEVAQFAVSVSNRCLREIMELESKDHSHDLYGKLPYLNSPDIPNPDQQDNEGEEWK